MSQYKKSYHRAGSSSRKKSIGNTLIGLFVGLIIGIIIAAAVVWYIQKTPAPFATPQGPAPTARNVESPGQPATPAPLPGKPGDKPDLTFYKILSGKAEAVPDSAGTNTTETKTTESKTPEIKPAEIKAAETKIAETKSTDAKSSEVAKVDSKLKEVVYLQTGSFQNASEADNQKARLAMMGSEASVQQVMLQEKVWYRVRLGPFSSINDVNNMRSELAKQGIPASVVKKD